MTEFFAGHILQGVVKSIECSVDRSYWLEIVIYLNSIVKIPPLTMLKIKSNIQYFQFLTIKFPEDFQQFQAYLLKENLKEFSN